MGRRHVPSVRHRRYCLARRRSYLYLMPPGNHPIGRARRDLVRLALNMTLPVGAPWVVRGSLTQAEYAGLVGEALATFRKLSNAQGMLMTDVEIRHNCWAPMLAKLVDGPVSEIGETFKDRTLCFLAWTAFGDSVRNGDAIDIFVAADRVTTVFRRPRRIFRRNRCRLGQLSNIQD